MKFLKALNSTPARNIWFFLTLVVLSTGCKNQHSGSSVVVANETKTPKNNQQGPKLVFAAPNDRSTHTIGDQIEVILSDIKGDVSYDSVMVSCDKMVLISFYSPPFKTVWDTRKFNPGSRTLKAEIYQNGKILTRSTRSLILNSDIVPEVVQCQVIRSYPHDPKAYTQGLIIDNGTLYEGTGQRGASTLRKLNLETGELEASLNLPPDLFGEGICVFNDKIIQLTWTSGFGFIYDKESFQFLKKVNYNTQGWGISYNGTHFIMSDGSHVIYFLETDNFGEVSRIEVFDDKGPVRNLNELEYVDGYLYANIYLKDIIALIDLSTGKVLKYIDCKGLLKEKEKNEETDVLNGIAYDHQTKRLYITGKNWPKLFEIRPIH